MQLSKFTDFGFRILISLAKTRQKTTVRELSQDLDVSKNHLSKVVHRLSHLGYIDGVRGRDGGIYLKVEPQNIKLADLIIGLEGKFDLVPCMNANCDTETNNSCTLKAECLMGGVLNKALGTFYAALGQVSLLDAMKNQGPGESIDPLKANVQIA